MGKKSEGHLGKRCCAKMRDFFSPVYYLPKFEAPPTNPLSRMRAHLLERGVKRVVVLVHRVVRLPVVRDGERPASPLRVVHLAAVKDVAMEEHGVSRVELRLNQREHLLCLQQKCVTAGCVYSTGQ